MCKVKIRPHSPHVPVRPPTMCERSCTSAQPGSAAASDNAMSGEIVFTAAHCIREHDGKRSKKIRVCASGAA